MQNISLCFIIFFFLASSCSFYPNKLATKKPFSYQEGQVADWQNSVRRQWPSLLQLNAADLDHRNQNGTFLKLIQPNLNLLKKHASLGKIQIYDMGNEEGDPLQQTEICNNPSSSDLINFFVYDPWVILYDCGDPDRKVIMTEVTFEGHEGYLITATLFAPQYLLRSLENTPLLPTMIYYHGHSTLKEDAAINKNHYTKGMGYSWAKQGYVVLVPSIRGFEKNNKDHRKMVTDFKNDGKAFLSIATLDALYAQDALENMDWKSMDLPFEINREKNAIIGVSLGGQIALLAGALDERFETISIHSSFFGYEVLMSNKHHACQDIPALRARLNIFDVGLMIYPRHLHIAMGGKDRFYNRYSTSAMEFLIEGWKCEPSKDTCGLTIDISKNSKHEYIIPLGRPNEFQERLGRHIP